MRYKTSLLLACVLTLCGTTSMAHAQMHTITFDTDASGNAILEGDTISEQYAAWGAHFVPNVLGGPDVTGDNFASNTDMTATASDFDPAFLSDSDPSELPTGNLLHGFTGYNSEDGSGNFWVAFDTPANAVSLDVYGYGVPYEGFAVYGLDSAFNLVNVGVLDTSGSPTGLHAVTTLSDNTPISYLVVTDGIDGYSYDTWAGVDNIRFTAVPEPGSVALLMGVVVSSAGLLARRRRK